MNCDSYWYNSIIDDPILLPQYRVDKNGWVFEQFKYDCGYTLELFVGYDSEARFYTNEIYGLYKKLGRTYHLTLPF